MEDELVWDFIKYVATLDLEIAIKAKAVLQSRGIEFARWCA